MSKAIRFSVHVKGDEEFECFMDVGISGRYYSMYGHIEKLARAMEEGAKSVEGVEVHLFQVSVSCYPYKPSFDILYSLWNLCLYSVSRNY
jgi:hypothetical protein